MDFQTSPEIIEALNKAVSHGIYGYSESKEEYFDAVYNSKNIEEAFCTNPDLLVYAGLRAEKYLANNAPEQLACKKRMANKNTGCSMCHSIGN